MADSPTSKTCPKKFILDSIRAMSPKKKQPNAFPVDETIPVPTDAKPWIPIEISNYPPTLTRDDIHSIFKDFAISPDFVLPARAKFAYPFRTTLWVAGIEEVHRVVKELDGAMVQGRKMCVKSIDPTSFEEREIVVQEMADELKIAIINTARVYYPQHSAKVLDVREHIDGSTYYAFLQARGPITVFSNPEAHVTSARNTASWEFLAAGMSEVLNDSHKKGEGWNGRLAALKDLLRIAEGQGAAIATWKGWKGSWTLDHESCKYENDGLGEKGGAVEDGQKEEWSGHAVRSSSRRMRERGKVIM